MTAQMTKLGGAALMAVFGSLALALAAPAADDTCEVARRMFGQRIGAYAAIHGQLETSLSADASPAPHPAPPDTASRAAAIKAARPGARQGDIFTPSVALCVRRTVASALGSDAVGHDVRELYGTYSTTPYHPDIYAIYPSWAMATVPATLLATLWPLAGDLEYRIIDHDLVLWDVHAQLVVDYLADLVPRSFDQE